MNNREKLIQTFGSVVIGNCLIAFAVSAFVSSSGIIMGGTTGIALILTHYVPTLPLSACVLAINLMLFLLGTFFLGKTFAAATAASTFLYPAALQIFEWFPILPDASDDILLCAIFGGLLLGIGAGIIDRTGGSTGGTDVIALIINKYTRINVGTLLYFIDGSVLLIQALFSNTNQILYGILFLILQVLAINRTMLSGRIQIQLLIISDFHDKIWENLLSDQDVGATVFPIEKGYTGSDSKGIICIISRKKLHRILNTINQIDENAFITIHEVNEVRGGGFSRERIKLSRDYKADFASHQ